MKKELLMTQIIREVHDAITEFNEQRDDVVAYFPTEMDFDLGVGEEDRIQFTVAFDDAQEEE